MDLCKVFHTFDIPDLSVERVSGFRQAFDNGAVNLESC